MNLPIDFEPEALEEVEAVFVWYENEQPGLGERFFTALLEQLDRIEENPKAHAVIYRKVRACLVPGFKYVIYYRLMDDSIKIIAVQHGHRNPRAWRRRA